MRRLAVVFGVIVSTAALWRLRSRLCRLLGCPAERITISSPGAGATISSPIAVSGWGQATQHNQLAVEIKDSSDTTVGSGSAAVSGALGQPGPFAASVAFTPGAPGSPGVIQVYDSSPATGSMTHLASVLIRF